MEKFKLEIFEREHPHQTFPKFHALGSAEVERFRQAISKAMRNFENKGSIPECFYAGGRRSDISAENEAFDIAAFAQSHGIQMDENIYLAWGRLLAVDKMRSEDFVRYFHQLWYPGPDDLLVFDETMGWFISISHSGDVRIQNSK